MVRRTSAGLALMLAVTLTACSSNTNIPTVVDASFNKNAGAQEGLYTVKRGDTIYSIAWQQNVDYRQLAELNNISPPYALQPGQTLRLNANVNTPASGGSTGTHAIALGGSTSQQTGQQAGSDTDDSWLAPDEGTITRNQGLNGSTGTQATSVSDTATQAANDLGGSAIQQSTTGAGVQSGVGASSSTQAPSSAAQPSSPDSVSVAGQSASQPSSSSTQKTYVPAQNIQWQWPVNGEVVGTFADKTNLTAGIDIAGQKGQSVKAAGPGIVVYAGSGVRGYGKLIILKHNDHFLSAYAHNDTLKVKENDVVDAGQVIATMGDSDADRVELHFEIRQDGQPKDPLKFLPDR